MVRKKTSALCFKVRHIVIIRVLSKPFAMFCNCHGIHRWNYFSVCDKDADYEDEYSPCWVANSTHFTRYMILFHNPLHR